MELRGGYKQTEVGLIPDDWDATSLGTLVTMVASGRSKVASMFGGFPIYGSTGAIGFTESPEYDGDAILVARVGANAGKLNVISGRYGVTDNTIIVRLHAGCCLPFVVRQLERKRLNTLVYGSGQPLITGTQLKGLLICVPPLREQRVIAAVLSDADALIGSLDGLIAKKRDLKQAVMQELLTGKTRLPGFLGEWTSVTLGERGNFSKGRGVRRDQVRSEGLPCVRYGEIYTHHHDIVREYNSFIGRKVALESQRLKQGDLLFAGSGETAEEIGKCAAFIGSEEAYAGSDIVIFSPRADNSVFLGYLMNHSSIVRQKARMGQGDAVVHISARNLATISFGIPEPDEQAAIAVVLSGMDADLAALEAKCDKAHALKLGMMQELLTGKIRLI